jgi:hypothetical protein
MGLLGLLFPAEQAIFLVRFPSARAVVHEEETEQDSFDVLTERAEGLGWMK